MPGLPGVPPPVPGPRARAPPRQHRKASAKPAQSRAGPWQPMATHGRAATSVGRHAQAMPRSAAPGRALGGAAQSAQRDAEPFSNPLLHGASSLSTSSSPPAAAAAATATARRAGPATYCVRCALRADSCKRIGAMQSAFSRRFFDAHRGRGGAGWPVRRAAALCRPAPPRTVVADDGRDDGRRPLLIRLARFAPRREEAFGNGQSEHAIVACFFGRAPIRRLAAAALIHNGSQRSPPFA